MHWKFNIQRKPESAGLKYLIYRWKSSTPACVFINLFLLLKASEVNRMFPRLIKQCTRRNGRKVDSRPCRQGVKVIKRKLLSWCSTNFSELTLKEITRVTQGESVFWAWKEEDLDLVAVLNWETKNRSLLLKICHGEALFMMKLVNWT